MLLLLIRIFYVCTDRKTPSYSVDRKILSEDHPDGWTVITMDGFLCLHSDGEGKILFLVWILSALFQHDAS